MLAPWKHHSPSVDIPVSCLPCHLPCYLSLLPRSLGFYAIWLDSVLSQDFLVSRAQRGGCQFPTLGTKGNWMQVLTTYQRRENEKRMLSCTLQEGMVVGSNPRGRQVDHATSSSKAGIHVNVQAGQGHQSRISKDQ